MFSATGLTAALAILALTVNVIDTSPAPPDAAGATLVVAADGSGQFATIQAAVDAAADGDTITVMPGTYEESVRVSKDVTVAGGGADAAEVVVRIPEDAPYELVPDTMMVRSAFLLKDAAAGISNLTIQGPGRGVSALAVIGGDVTIHDVAEELDPYVSYPYGFLYASGDSTGDVYDNTSKAFVWLAGTSSIALHDNVIHSAVRSEGSSTSRIHDNDVGGVWVGTSAAPIIEGNRIDYANNGEADGGFSSCAIQIGGRDARPTIIDNSISKAPIGICIANATPVEIRDNSLDHNLVAIRLQTSDTTVTGNEIVGEAQGIEIYGSGAPTISENTVHVGGLALSIKGGSPVIDGNQLCGGEGSLAVSDSADADVGDNEVC